MKFSVLTNSKGPLNKTIDIKDGKLKKGHPDPMHSGTIRSYDIELKDLAVGLQRLESCQSFVHGTVKDAVNGETFKVVPAKQYNARPEKRSVSRTTDCIGFLGCHLSMLDHDPDSQCPYDCMAPASLLPILAAQDSQWQDAGHWVVPSTSAGISVDGDPVAGGSAYHIYFEALSAENLKDYMLALFKLSVIAGHGWIKLSSNGAMNIRSCFDGSVYSPERIDFTAPPTLISERLSQDRPDPVYQPGGAIDCSRIPVVDDAAYQSAVKALKEDLGTIDRSNQLAERKAITISKERKITIEQARELISGQVSGDLYPDDVIVFQERGRVLVSDVLANRGKYDLEPCADPGEPECGTSKAKFFANKSGKPVIHSFLHGTKTFFLQAAYPVSPKAKVEVKATTASPLPLVKKREAAAPFPFDALGPIMGDACKALQKGIQAPDAIVAQSVLGSVNLVVQAIRDVMIDGRVSPLTLYLLTIAATGERKTAVDRIATAIHREIERGNISRASGEQSTYELVKAAYEHDKQALIKNGKKSLEEKQAGLEQLQRQEPDRPLDQTILVTDFTFEGLFKLYQVGVPCKGLFADEGGQVTGGHGMRRESKLATATGLSKFWDGSRVDRVRALDGVSHLYGRRLAVHLMMQEDVGLEFYTDDVLRDQGLISRFLAAWPTSTVGTRKYRSVNTKESPAMKVFYQRVSEAMARPLQYEEDSNEQELNPSKIVLSPEAKALWEALYNSIEDESARGKRLGPIRGFANKAAEHAVRIAGTIQIFEDLDSTEIKADAMGCGVKVIEWYLTEALRMTGSFAPDNRLLKAQSVLRWIINSGLKRITLPDIYQQSPVRSVKQAREIVHILVDHNCLFWPRGRGVQNAIETQDGKASREWLWVHPTLRSGRDSG